jgi:hypothetical protein
VIRAIRPIIACLLALALPLQAAAFTMAKVGGPHEPAIAAMAHSHAHTHAGGHAGHAHPAVPADPCDDETNTGILKCCHTPIAWLDTSSLVIDPASSSFPRHSFVAQWTSFIPDEPSPPPITDPFAG